MPHIKKTMPWTAVQPQSTTFRWLYVYLIGWIGNGVKAPNPLMKPSSLVLQMSLAVVSIKTVKSARPLCYASRIPGVKVDQSSVQNSTFIVLLLC